MNTAIGHATALNQLRRLNFTSDPLGEEVAFAVSEKARHSEPCVTFGIR